MRRFLPHALLIALAIIPFAGMLSREEVPIFRDHEGYFLPLRWHTATALRAGELPLWNAWNGLGEPWLANPQTAVFYPPAWIFLAVPFSAAYVLFLALHLGILGSGAWLLFRRWADGPAAWFGAAVLMLSGPVVSLLDVNNNLASFAWMPWALRLAFERREDRSRSLVPLIAVLALGFLGGEPLYAAVAAFAVALALATRRDWRGIAAAAGGSIALSAVQLLPFLEWIRGSDRARGLDPAEAFHHSMAVGDWVALTMSSASATAVLEPLRISQQFIPSLYVGVPTVILALASGLGSMRTERPERRRVLAMLLFSFTIVVVLSAAGQIPGVREVLLAARFDALRYPARLVPLGVLLVCGLAAIGLDRVRQEPLGSRVGITLSIAALGGIRFLTLEPLGNATTALRFGIFLAWVVAFGLVYVAFPRWLDDRRILALLAAVLLADLVWAAQPMLGSSALRPNVRVWSESIETPWRVARVEPDRALPFPQRGWLIGYLNLYDRIFDFSTAAPLQDAKVNQFHAATIRGDRDDLADLASLRWILTRRTRLVPGYRPTLWSREGIRLFENAGALPPAQFWPAGAAVAGDGGSLERLLRGTFDAGSRIEIDPAPLFSGAGGAPSAAGPVRFGHRSVSVRARAPGDGWIMLTQLAAPGWTAFVDGRRVTGHVADGLFRAVAVTRGTRVIEWRYRPWSLVIGAAITSIFVIWLTVSEIARARRRRLSS